MCRRRRRRPFSSARMQGTRNKIATHARTHARASVGAKEPTVVKLASRCAAPFYLPSSRFPSRLSSTIRIPNPCHAILDPSPGPITALYHTFPFPYLTTTTLPYHNPSPYQTTSPRVKHIILAIQPAIHPASHKSSQPASQPDRQQDS